MEGEPVGKKGRPLKKHSKKSKLNEQISELFESEEPPLKKVKKGEINGEKKRCLEDSEKAVRPPPRVIEFVEPGKQRTEKRSLPMVKRKKRKNKANLSSQLDSSEPDFRSIAREVKEFGITGLSIKQRKKYKQQKAQFLGGKAPKGQKMPYPMLMDHIKNRKEKEKGRQEREHAMGIFKKNKADKQRAVPTRTSMGRWVDNSSKGLVASVGKYKAGVQRLSKADILKITSKSTKR